MAALACVLPSTAALAARNNPDGGPAACTPGECISWVDEFYPCVSFDDGTVGWCAKQICEEACPEEEPIFGEPIPALKGLGW